MLTKRDLLRQSSALLAAAAVPRELHAAEAIAAGPFKSDWESLKSQYHAPDWFRDAKFGIWAHWSAQCVPEAGDWYARNMYIQGEQAVSASSRALRPSRRHRLHGDEQSLEGRTLAIRRN